MFDNIAVNVCIGLIFIILLYSLLATVLQEIIARWFGLRARVLAKGLKRMLEDDREMKSALANLPPSVRYFVERTTFFGFLIHQFFKVKFFFRPLNPDSLTRKFYDHPSIKYLGENQWFSKPSYITPSNFSQTMVQLLRGENYDGAISQADAIKHVLETNKLSIDSDTLYFLKALLADANYDIGKFRKALEKWFSETMERATGWYKRKVQFWLFVIGLSLAVFFNLDIIVLAKILSKDKSAREALAAINQSSGWNNYVGKGASINDSLHENTILQYLDSSIVKTFTTSTQDIEESVQILGIRRIKKAECDQPCKEKLNSLFDQFKSGDISYASFRSKADDMVQWQEVYHSSFFEHCVGVFIAALSISLGAPFWFDLLNKFMLLRGAVKKPEKKTSLTNEAVSD